jgi:uncharacterized RDD family membrane protein YckC
MFCSTCGANAAAADRFCPNCGAAMAATQAAMAPPSAPAAVAAATALPPHSVVYAGFWLRFCSAIIDWIAVVVINALISMLMTPFIGFFCALISGWLYHALLESSEHQATFGKMAMSIYVTDLDGRRISFGTATTRHFCKILSGLMLMIGFIMAGLTARKQGLHDMIANTLVVKR